jgi:hypothetical protein|nr:MAG TPA_asm: hypothetical protein [Caudoviricetes sp.]
MAEEKIFTAGLTAIKVKPWTSATESTPVFADTDLLGYTEEGSCSLTAEDPEETEIYAEELDTPVKVFTKEGKTTLAFNVLNPSVTVLQKMMGGTGTEATGSTGASWKAPKSSFAGEYHVKIEPKEGYQITLPKVKLHAKISSTFGKTDLLKLEITGTILQPTTDNVPKMTLEKPAND